MNLFPNRENNRIFLRFAGCVIAEAAVTALFACFVPHFPGWPAVGPAALMLLLALFVIPQTMRQRP